MFERIFVALLRLYPSHFRKLFREEARQLIRERFRDELGLRRRFRLCLDLIVDLAIGLPAVWRTTPAEPTTAPVFLGAENVPYFRVLDEERTNPVPFLVGSAVTLAALGLFSFVISHPPRYIPPPGAKNQRSPIEAVMERLNQPSLTGTIDSQQHEDVMPDSKTSVPATRPSRPAIAAAPIPGWQSIAPIAVAPPTGIGNHPQSTRPDAFAGVVIRNFANQNVRPDMRQEAIAGTWQGTLPDLRSSVKVSGTRDGQVTVTLYPMDRSGQVFPAEIANFHEGELQFYIRAMDGRYEGKMAQDGLSIAGTWKEAGSSRPLLLRRTAR
jgi:hypothetical protein